MPKCVVSLPVSELGSLAPFSLFDSGRTLLPQIKVQSDPTLQTPKTVTENFSSSMDNHRNLSAQAIARLSLPRIPQARLFPRQAMLLP